MSEAGKVIHIQSGRPYDVYAGRTMPRLGLRDEGWGNPFKPGRDGDLEAVLRRYERLLRDHLRVDEDGEIAGALAGLRGKTLACFCAEKDGPLTLDDPIVCHAQILLKLAEEIAGDA